LGRSWAARERRQSIETIGSAVVEAFHQMSVAVHRHLDRLVTEPGLEAIKLESI